MHDNAWIYDLEVGTYTADLPYWTGLVDEYQARRVLDLACGTGRITFPLAERGLAINPDFKIVGLDNSAAMLERARARLGEIDPAPASTVSFVKEDMVRFDLDETFDLIVVGLNSLMYVYGIDDQLSCLSAVRRHLAPRGRFAIDVLMPLLTFLEEAERTPTMRLEVDLAAPEQGVKRFLRFATERYDAVRQVDDTIYFYEIYYTDGRQERFTDDLAWHMYFPQELELLMRSAGMKVTAKFGDYDRSPFNRRSRQYLWVMEAV